MDDGFRLGLVAASCGLEAEEIGEGKAEPADEADVEELPPGDAAEMGGIIIPGDGLEFAHRILLVGTACAGTSRTKAGGNARAFYAAFARAGFLVKTRAKKKVASRVNLARLAICASKGQYRLADEEKAARCHIKFWGVRGSVPTPGAATVKYGGNTSCVEVRADGQIIVLDAGTGIRPLGLELAREFDGAGDRYDAAHHPHPLGSHPGVPFFPAGLRAEEYDPRAGFRRGAPGAREHAGRARWRALIFPSRSSRCRAMW